MIIKIHSVMSVYYIICHNRSFESCNCLNIVSSAWGRFHVPAPWVLAYRVTP